LSTDENSLILPIFPFQLKIVPLHPNYLHPLSGFEKTRAESKMNGM